ncbi:MAG: phosphatidylserine decarboxylase [Opitutales bacterium]
MAKEAPIEYFDRYAEMIRIERVYGESWLRWVYGNSLGRMTLWALLCRPFFSKWYGRRMLSSKSRSRIKPFIRDYDVDAGEFADSVSTYDSFNDFFIRKLKPSSRPISPDENTAVFSADGRHLGFDDISSLDAVFAKGQSFNLPQLFGSREAALPFEGGTVVISRLCPMDYHRFHFPVAGEASSPILINGCLKSVNPIALRRYFSILWENKRYLSFMESERFGRVACFEIGATCVGSVQYGHSFPVRVRKGEEKGWFSFGGSMILTFFEKGRIRLADDLLAHSAKGRELYAKMGDAMGRID